MIDQFSPLSRRLIAVGLLILALLLLVFFIVVPLYSTVGSAVSDMRDAQFRLERLEAIRARPLPARTEPIPAEQFIKAANAEAATELLIAQVNTAVTASQVTMDAPVYADTPPGPQMLAVALRGSGPADAVFALFNQIERGVPAVRFKAWQISAADATGKTLRFEAVALAAWGAL